MTADLSPFEYAARHFKVKGPHPYLADPVGWVSARLGGHLWTKQQEIARSVVANRRTAVKSCHNAGKGLPLDTRLPTPSGWTTMADVNVGTLLLDERGRACTVEAVSEIWSRPCYRVFFSDGAEIVTDDGHLWSVLRLDDRHSLRERNRQHRIPAPTDWRDHWDLARVASTPQIAETLRTSSGQLRHAIPYTAALELPEADLPIAPYVLGAWLGDGTSVRPEITCDPLDREIVDRIAALGENVRRRESSKFAWTLTGPLADRPLLQYRLRALGVLGNKHIPAAYLRSSREQRIELLRGLMDTDGFNGRGSVGMDLMSERLADDVAELVRSLGCAVQVRKCRATCNGVDAGIRYRMAWRPLFQPFHLVRKAVAWSPPESTSSRRTIRTITRVEPVETVPTRCIQVSSESKLYLATEHFIPTHNSHLAGKIAAWWIDVHPPGEAFVVSTAPSYPQVHAILWEEIRKTAKIPGREPLIGRVLQSDEWKLDDGTLIGWGRKPADTDQHGFQGIHRKYVLAILDEACGIPEQIWTAVEAITTNQFCRILAIGNPDDPNTEFGKVCKPGSGWNTIKVSAFDTPNFTSEPFPEDLRPLMLDPEWVEDKKRRWGETSPRYVAKVLGEFPELGDDTLISPRWIEAAQQRTLVPGPRSVLGVDVARFGSDRTIIALLRGCVARVVGDYGKLRTTETTGKVIAAKREHRADETRVDGVGVGSGVVDELLEAGHDVIDMQSGAAALDSEHFANARAEWWWGLRQRFEAGDIDIDPLDDEMAAQLGTIKFKYTARGQVLIESKDDMRKRGLPSPDRADTLMLATAHVLPPDDVVGEDDLDDDLDGFEISPI